MKRFNYLIFEPQTWRREHNSGISTVSIILDQIIKWFFTHVFNKFLVFSC